MFTSLTCFTFIKNVSESTGKKTTVSATQTYTHIYEYTSSSEFHKDKLELWYTYIHKTIFTVFQVGFEFVNFL